MNSKTRINLTIGLILGLLVLLNAFISKSRDMNFLLMGANIMHALKTSIDLLVEEE